MSVLVAALRYAEFGWHVFPCKGKVPLTEHGFKDASADPERIREWWQWWPEANVAIRTGRESGLLVLDVDPRHGGDEALHELERRHGALPATAEVLTGGGGRHIYFLHRGEEIACSANVLGPGLDVRGDGGYVVAPPSIHPETSRRYHWEVSSRRPAEPVAWVLERLAAAAGMGRNGAAPIGEEIPEGVRDRTLASLAGTMRRRGMSMAAIEAALKVTSRESCKPPLSERQVEKIARSVGRYSPADAGDQQHGEDRGQEDDRDPGDGLPWRWADELVATAPPEPEWAWHGYMAAGTKSMLAGLPKAGKSTLVTALVEAIAGEEESFLGRRVRSGSVVLVSEEGDVTLAPKLLRLPAKRVRVLNRDATWPKPSWAELVRDATREALKIGAVALVVDSVSFWAQFESEAENVAGAAQAVMDELNAACSEELAVLLVHHQRKNPGGNHGTGARGSGALVGAVDVLIEYERLGEDAPSAQRRLVTLSRWPTTPDVLVIEHDRHEASWRVIGETDSRHGSDLLGIRECLLRALPAEAPGATEDELAELVGLDKRKVSGPLRQLVADELVSRTGEGVRGKPFCYSRGTL